MQDTNEHSEEENPNEDLMREAPRHANDKCLECTRKHLLAALGHLTCLENSPMVEGALDPTLRPALVAYEHACIYAMEAVYYGPTFMELCISSLVLCEEAMFRVCAEEAESCTDSNFFYTLRALRKDLMAGKVPTNKIITRLHALRQLPPFDTVSTANRCLNKAIANIEEAVREVPGDALVNASQYDEYLILRDLVQASEHLYWLSDPCKVSSICHTVKGALLDASTSMRVVQEMFQGGNDAQP